MTVGRTPRPTRATLAGRAYLDLRAMAKKAGRASDEYLRLYALEGFLLRLATSASSQDFVLKGGVLLAAYQLRRPTADIDFAALNTSNDVETVKSMIVTVAETQLPDDQDDGLWFDTSDTHAAVIRDEDVYSGVRVTLRAELSTAQMRFHVDVNVGDPIWPSPALLDLELNAVIDYGPAGTWLRVPMGKLASERSVPLDGPTLAVLDQWATRRGAHPPIPHPRTGKPTDFLFTEHGRRLGATRLRNGLLAGVAAADLRNPGGQPMTITPHQLRRTYATTLANAGMSLQALMALLGHATPEMTIRYATLASPTLRNAYDQAMGTMCRQLTLTPVGRPIVPDKVAWLASEMLKTRIAHSYCSRHESQGACPYANICETCDNYTAATEFAPALTDQLADIQALQADANRRGWTNEANRHDRVATAPHSHLDQLQPR